MQVGSIEKLISIFNQSFRKLGVEITPGKLEALAVTVYRAMTVQTRYFHTLDHIFNLVDPQNPITSLTALYHDIVYFQVDDGFSPQIWELLSAYIRRQDANLFIVDEIPISERMVWLTLELFNVRPGQDVSSDGVMNEFLSALTMNKQLEGLVSERDLLLITVCIEATIPFREIAPDEKNYFDEMELRLLDVVQRYNLGLSLDEMINGIQQAVSFANKDIENFAENDPGRFLENTWKLLPETNVALRYPGVYTVGAYREALQKMDNFFENLNINTIFKQYRGVPSLQEYARLVRQALYNLQIARNYMNLKILGSTILEALALSTGGDAPLVLFFGDDPTETANSKRLEYYLPEIADPAWVDRDSIIYQLLESGRDTETTFEMKNSPLSFFVYKSVRPERRSIYMQHMADFHAGRLSPVEFLQHIDASVLQPIARACAFMVPTRRRALLKYAGEVS